MQKLEKLRLQKVKAVELSKSEMKKIIGSGGCSASSCGGSCSYVIGGLTYSGNCDWDASTKYLLCACKVY